MAKVALTGDGTPPPGPIPGGTHEGEAALERLLDAVPPALQRHGWPGLDRLVLCAEAGVAASAFGDHFTDEQDCFLAAYRHHANRLVEAVRSGAADAVDDSDQVRGTFAALLGFLAGEPDVAELILVRVLGAGPQALAQRDRTAAQLSGLIAGRVLPGPADRAAAGALRRSAGGAVAQLLYSWVAEGHAGQLLELLPTCTYLALVTSHEPREAAVLAGLAKAPA